MNSNAIDELKVLIEADYSSLKVTLNQAMGAFTNFMSEVNEGQVNWVHILQGTFTPALVATIAATFALSIEQALQFQQAVQGASLNTASTFANTSSSMQNGAFAISAATGQSASDVETAIGQVSMVYKDYNDALTVTNALSEFATTEQISLSQATSEMLPLLQNWNVSAGDVGNTLAAMGQSTSFGKLSIQQLIDTLTSSGQAISPLMSLSSAVAQLQEASAQPGMNPSATENLWQTFVTGAQNAISPVNKVFGDMATYAKGPSGLGGAFDAIESKIQAWGPAAQAVAPQFGILANTVSTLMDKPVNDFSNINDLAQKFLANLQPLGAWFQQNQTVLDQMKEAWTTLIADLEVSAVPKVLQAMLDVIQGADTLAKLFNEAVGGSTSTTISTGLQSDFNSNTSSFAQGQGGLGQIIKDSFLEGINLLIGALKNPLNPTGTTVINNGSPGQVSSTASTSQLPSSH